jgi:hypothetical protein
LRESSTLRALEARERQRVETAPPPSVGAKGRLALLDLKLSRAAASIGRTRRAWRGWHRAQQELAEREAEEARSTTASASRPEDLKTRVEISFGRVALDDPSTTRIELELEYLVPGACWAPCCYRLVVPPEHANDWLTVEVQLSNVGDQSKHFTLMERIPISEIEKLEIEWIADRTEPKAKPDEHGILRWQIDLPPFAQKRVRLAYEVKRHSDVAGLSL